MKKVFYYFILLLITTGCTNENDFSTNEIIKEGELAKIVFELQILQSVNQSISTKSTAIDPETEVRELDVIVVSGNVIVEHIKVSAVDIKDSQSVANKKTAMVNLTQRAGCDLYIYANASGILPIGITLDELTTLENTFSPSTLPMKMGGQLTNFDIPSTGKFQITLYRDVAKISVEKGDCKECAANVDPELKENFTIKKLHLYGAADKGLLTRTESLALPHNLTYTQYENLNPLDIIYTYEAEAGKTYLILEAEYEKFGSSFYKIALYDQKNKVMFDVTRNHHYKVFIRKVTGNGYASKEEAKKYPSSNLVYEIVDQKYEIYDMATNGQYELGITDTLRIASAEGYYQTDVLLNSANGKELHADLNAQYDSFSSWVKNIISTNTTTSNAGRTKLHTFTFNIESNPTSEEREGYITFKAGNLIKKFIIIQEATDFISTQSVLISLNNGSYEDYWNFLNHKVDGVSTDKMNGVIRNRGLHFAVYNNTIKYQINIVKGTCQSYAQSDNNRFNVVRSGNTLNITTNNAEPDPWIENLIVTVENQGITHQEHYTIYKTGIFHTNNSKYLVGGRTGTKTYAYYEVVKIGTNYWLDRNLGASSNGFYTISSNISEGQDINAVGGYYKVRDKDKAASYSDLCPAGFRVPSQDELDNLSKQGFLSMVAGETSVGDSYWKPFLTTNNSKLSHVYLPMAGYMQTGINSTQGEGGYYWTSTYADYYEQSDFSKVEDESRCWQRRMQIRNSRSILMQFLPDRMANGSGGTLGEKYKGMLIRCIKTD